MPSKTLKQLKADKSKAERDLQTLQQQILMVQGVVFYLAQEITKLEATKPKEGV